MKPRPPLLRADNWATLSAHGRDADVGRPARVDDLVFWLGRIAPPSVDVFGGEEDDAFVMLVVTCITNPATAAIEAVSPDWSPT